MLLLVISDICRQDGY